MNSTLISSSGVGIGNELVIPSKLTKREMTLAERGKLCKDLEISQKAFSMAGDVLGDINSIPVIGEVAGIVTAGAAIVTHVTAGSLDIAQTALDCGDVPFEELKEFMDKKFNEVNRKLDSNSAALQAISKMVEKTLSAVEETRAEMNERFDEVLMSIEETKIEPIVSKISNFVRYFESEKERIRGLKQHEYVAKLEEEDSMLLFFKDSRTPERDNSLNSALFDIIRHGYAIPDSNEDEISFKALYALLYGTEAHVSVMTFLLEQYSYLANYHYERGNIEKYKEHFDSINSVFLEFRSSLVGTGISKSENLLEKVIETLTEITEIEFLRLEREDIIQLLNNKIDTFNKIKEDIREMDIAIVTETPENFVKLSFDNDIAVPIGEWESNIKVSYAVQYLQEGAFTMLGEWSDPVTVKTRACPTLRMPVDQSGRAIIVFRRFEDSKPQLVGSVKPYQEQFVDINRDLFNAAENPQSDIGAKEANILLSKGADVNMRFEKGRTVLHAVAESGNHDIATKILLQIQPQSIDVPDDDGFTPLHVAADTGNSGFVKFLINHGASVNMKTKRGELTPLHLVARRGFVKTFERLLESPKVNINEKNVEGFTPLHHAVLGGKYIVEAFIRNTKTNINAKSTKTRLTPFHLAVINNFVPVAQALIGSGKVEVNAGDKNNMTPLHYAAMMGHSNMMRYLVSLNGISPNMVTRDNKWSPLHYAIFFKHDDCALMLINSPNTDINLKANDGSTPLHFAVTFGRKNVVKSLLSKKANLEAQTKDGYTPLHLAAMIKDPEILSILVENGANIEAKTINGATPLHSATFAGRTKTALALLDKGANFKVTDKDGQTPFHGAASTDQLEVIKKLIAREPSMIDIKNKNLDTALSLASQNSHKVLVKFLVKNGANVNTRNKDGISPLITFAMNDDLNMVQFLIDNGADVYTVDNNGMNFIYHAVKNGSLVIVEYAGKLPTIDWEKVDEKRKEECDREKCSIEHFAVCDSIKYGRTDIVRFLLGKFSKSTCEPVSAASGFGRLDIVKYLVEEKGMDVNPFKDYYNKYSTPICNAAKGGHLELVKYLLAHKADMYITCKYEYAIDLAIEHGHLNVVKYLTENGANLKKTNRYMNTPLDSTFRYGQYEILKYFIVERTKDIDINHRDKTQDTLLINCVASNRLDLVKILVEKGADVNAKNKRGETALDTARNHRMYHIVSYLEGITKNKRHFEGAKYTKEPHTNIPSNSHFEEKIGYTDYRHIKGEKETINSQPVDAISPDVDVIGTLMLLDLMIRYLTNQKYINKRDEYVSETEAQASALKITERFEELLNLFHSLPVEQIDFSEVHKNIYKALKSDRGSRVHSILCSTLDAISSLTQEEKEKLMSDLAITSTHLPVVTAVDTEYIDETYNLLTNHCHGTVENLNLNRIR